MPLPADVNNTEDWTITNKIESALSVAAKYISLSSLNRQREKVYGIEKSCMPTPSFCYYAQFKALESYLIIGTTLSYYTEQEANYLAETLSYNAVVYECTEPEVGLDVQFSIDEDNQLVITGDPEAVSLFNIALVLNDENDLVFVGTWPQEYTFVINSEGELVVTYTKI